MTQPYRWRARQQDQPRERVILREHGRHLPALQPGADRIRWRRPPAPAPGQGPVRLHDQTCTCRNPLFEYVSAGGLYFVRRVDAGPPVTVVETERLRERHAAVLWGRILSGQAR